ncbi:unnamed protein product [Closterium sp. Naga37s-1]|nr:unnamed protein product [Closterium sp. Naga37s-1]
MLLPGKIHHVLSPGNLCIKEVQEYLRGICPDVHVTRGEYDDDAQFPDTKVVVVGGFRIGLCHGHQVIPWGDVESLAMLQRQMGVDILITGHTHRFKAYRHQGRLLINPGTALHPSFVLMDVDGARVVVYIYELVGGDVKVDKIEFKKPVAGAQ